jgi:hypothetical protein
LIKIEFTRVSFLAGVFWKSRQPCFSATWATVKPLDKLAFGWFANSGILAK